MLNIKKIFRKRVGNNLLYGSLILIMCLFSINAYFIYEDFFLRNPDPVYTISFLLVSLIFILIVCVLIITNRVSSTFSFIKGGKRRVSKLRKRIIIAFSIGAALPTIIVAVFSTYFFNFGVEAWFDKKVSRVLDQSIIVGESYIAEHILQLKETAISVSDDLSDMYYNLIHDPELFNKVINAQAEMRSLDEAIVFQKDTNTILAQTALSFFLPIMLTPAHTHALERADKGEVVQVPSDTGKIRILIKLKDYNDTYLIIGRLVDVKITDHINKTNGAAKEYFELKRHISSTQIKFSIVFILLSLVLLLVATIWGRNFAEKIVKPIRELVIAAEKVKNGDLSAQVPLEGLRKDEIRVLSTAFNRMVSQIDRQQKDLIIAQRSLAWSDVARRVAHEIKNPLTPIQLSAERVLKKFSNEISDKKSFEKYLHNILRHSNDIKNIVSEFVDFARLPSPIFVKCEVVSLINDLVESRKLINHDITYHFESNVREYDFVCDVSQMNRVVVNLLLNSEEAFLGTESDKIIDVELDCDSKSVRLIISDNGTGFSQAMLSSAKEAYATNKDKGTGLGLAIVDRIVVEHNGKLEISNKKTGGAKIVLTFDTKRLKSYLK